MAKHPYKPRTPGSLKAAVSELIEACGGLAKVAKVVRVGATQLQRYSDSEEPVCHMPVDVVRALEGLCGQPIVTEYLAVESGYCLFRPPTANDAGQTLSVDFARTAQKSGKLFEDYANAMGNDGVIDAGEAAELIADTDHLLSVLLHLRAQLVARTGEKH